MKIYILIHYDTILNCQSAKIMGDSSPPYLVNDKCSP
jgi:hypothetical protein